MKIEFVASDISFASTWEKWRKEPESLAFNPVEGLDFEQISQRLIDQAGGFDHLEDQRDRRWFVLKNSVAVGTVGLNQINLRMKSASFGYQVGKEFSGQGLGTEIVSQFVKFLFENTEIYRLTATVHCEHSASQRILSKLGFTKEGLLREYLIIGNERVDFFAYSILASDWNG